MVRKEEVAHYILVKMIILLQVVCISGCGFVQSPHDVSDRAERIGSSAFLEHIETQNAEADEQEYDCVLEKLRLLSPYLTIEDAVERISREDIKRIYNSAYRNGYEITCGNRYILMDTTPELRRFMEIGWPEDKGKRRSIITKEDAESVFEDILKAIGCDEKYVLLPRHIERDLGNWIIVAPGIYSGVICSDEYIMMSISIRGGYLRQYTKEVPEYQPVYIDPVINKEEAVKISYEWMFSPKDRIINKVKGITKEKMLTKEPIQVFMGRKRWFYRTKHSCEENKEYGQFWKVEMCDPARENTVKKYRYFYYVYVNAISGEVEYSSIRTVMR